MCVSVLKKRKKKRRGRRPPYMNNNNSKYDIVCIIKYNKKIKYDNIEI